MISLWYGNWNHLVCHKWKCEVQHPSQSTVVNLGKKQKWCSLWCLWSQVQQDTSGPYYFRILCCLWTVGIHHRCTYKWDWTKMLTLPRWEQRLHKFRLLWIQKNVGEKRGTSRTHWNADCLLANFSVKTTKILSTRNSSILMMSSSEYLFLEPEFSFTNYVSSCPNICIYGYRFFLKMRAF